ncbi:MAG: inositol monophosphatase family protein [Phycisphaerales bacterium]
MPHAPQHEREALLIRMREAVALAARATRSVRAGFDGASHAKDDRSPVTVADWASQAVVSMTLGDALPLVGEEEAAALRSDANAPLRARVVAAAAHALGRTVGESECLDAIDRGRAAPCARFLTLDPVDGTKGFLRGQQYAISLALVEDGSVTAGVVGCPSLPEDGGDLSRADPEGCVAFATLGGGAWITRGAEAPRRAAIANWSPGAAVRACESVESAHSRQDLSTELLASIGTPGAPARLDSQCKYIVVARGGADIYMRLPVKADYREKIWDHAAGALVAAEAGAKVVDVDGRPLDFGCGRELLGNRGVFAGHAAIVDRLVEEYARLAARSG